MPSCSFYRLHRAKKLFRKQPSVDNVSETSVTDESVPESLNGTWVSQSPFQYQCRNHGCKHSPEMPAIVKNNEYYCLKKERLLSKMVTDYYNFFKTQFIPSRENAVLQWNPNNWHLLHLNPPINICHCHYKTH